MTTHLALALPPERLFAADAALMARSDPAQLQLLGVNDLGPDMITTQTLGLWPGRHTIRHRAGATDAILRMFDRAGVDVSERMHLFSTGAEAAEAADRLVAAGYRLQSIYPLPPGRWPDSAQVVPPPLWASLNAKDELSALVDPAHLAPRRVVTFAGARALTPHFPVWVKLAQAPATAFGIGIRFCPDATSYAAALADLADLCTDSPQVVVEDHVDIGTCWCACLVVTKDRTHLVGSAAQIFKAPGRQTGNRIDPTDPMPTAAIPVVVAAAEAARRRGFTGIAGLDLGQARDGRIVVFDPNYRLNASSAQILFHPAAAARTGLSVSQSVALATELSMPDILSSLSGLVDDHLFIPTRLFDGAAVGATRRKSAVNGFVMGRDTDDAAARADSVVRNLTS